nr:hypothetical protein [Mesorhizobium sp. M6A.T.Ce.TU.016.01.1.1]
MSAVISNWTGRPVFCWTTIDRARAESPIGAGANCCRGFRYLLRHRAVEDVADRQRKKAPAQGVRTSQEGSDCCDSVSELGDDCHLPAQHGHDLIEAYGVNLEQDPYLSHNGCEALVRDET